MDRSSMIKFRALTRYVTVLNSWFSEIYESCTRELQ